MRKEKGATMEIKKCPFCGGEARMHDHLVSYYIECVNCKAGIEQRTDTQAIEAWNRRVNDERKETD